MEDELVNIITKKRFSKLVEEYVYRYRIPYIDAVLKLCEERLIEPHDSSNLLSNVIKDKIKSEAVSSKLIKGGNKLPV